MPTQDLPGVEGEGVADRKIKSLDNAIADWRDAVKRRMALTEEEVAASAKVVDLMHKNALTTYPYYDDDDEKKNVVLEGTEKLRMKKVKAAAEPSEGKKGDNE